MQRLCLLALISLAHLEAQACPRCAPVVRAGVFDAQFLETLALMMVPLLVVGAIAALLHRL